MNDSQVRFPVKCPTCGDEELSAFAAGAVADALINARPIRLSAACHGLVWLASDYELEQIKEYLGIAWIEAHKARLNNFSA